MKSLVEKLDSSRNDVRQLNNHSRSNLSNNQTKSGPDVKAAEFDMISNGGDDSALRPVGVRRSDDTLSSSSKTSRQPQYKQLTQKLMTTPEPALS